MSDPTATEAWTEYQRWVGDGGMPQGMHTALFAAYPGASHEFLHHVWLTPPFLAGRSRDVEAEHV